MTATRYIIMADGKMTRWKNFLVPKHMLPVHGEPILLRTVRLVRRFDPNAEIIITSHNPSYEVPGTVRYEPQNNHCEIDRFTWELIGDGPDQATMEAAVLPVRRCVLHRPGH